MMSAKLRTTFLGAALLISACSFSEEALWPSLTGEEPADGTTGQPADDAMVAESGQSGTLSSTQPSLGASSFDPIDVSPGEPTGTFVGDKVIELRGELQQLQRAIGQHNQILQEVRTKTIDDSRRYHNTVAVMNARLQVGTTPGNPILVEQFNNAQMDLDQLESDISIMNQLAQAVSDDSSMSAFLLESVYAAFDVSGAVDEDHRQLAVLEDEINRTVVLIERLLKEVSDDVSRQTAYVSTERSNLNLLSAGIRSGEIYGISLVNQAMASAAGSGGNVAGQPMDIAGRRPLVVIQFDRNNVPFQQVLYNAVNRVLDQRPDAVFDLVAVTPSSGDEATIALNSSKSRRHAENVLRSLVDMGLPPDRVAISGQTASNASVNEVRLYIR